MCLGTMPSKFIGLIPLLDILHYKWFIAFLPLKCNLKFLVVQLNISKKSIIKLLLLHFLTDKTEVIKKNSILEIPAD